MMYYCQSKNKKDLQSILELGRKNLYQAGDLEEKINEGFITVQYTIEELEKMASIHKQLIVKDLELNCLAGYALLLDRQMADEIPYLLSFFKQINALNYQQKKISELSYIVMGQICIDKKFRGKGVFRKLYEHFIEVTKESYDYVITEINSKNKRSLLAHERVGFQTLHEFTSEDGESWRVVILPTR